MRRLLSAAAVAACLAVPATASATFPGDNGAIGLGNPPRLVEPDGSGLRQIAPQGSTLSFSADGTKVAYTIGNVSTGAQGIAINNAEGGDEQVLFPISATSPFDPVWFPDGQTLGAVRPSAGGGFEFVRIDIATRSVTTVAANVFSPQISPNGQLVLFSRAGDLWLMNADGTNQRVLTSGRSGDFSPDGTQVVFWRGSAGFGDLYVIDVDGTDERALTTDGDFNAAPVWSPDGTQIAFERDGQLWVIDADGTDARSLGIAGGADDWQREPSVAAPDCSAVKASPKTLWPPNNKLRTVRLLHPEGTTIDPEEVRLRAKKGAVYKVPFTLTNAAGDTCSGTVTIRVKKPKRK